MDNYTPIQERWEESYTRWCIFGENVYTSNNDQLTISLHKFYGIPWNYHIWLVFNLEYIDEDINININIKIGRVFNIPKNFRSASILWKSR